MLRLTVVATAIMLAMASTSYATSTTPTNQATAGAGASSTAASSSSSAAGASNKTNVNTRVTTSQLNKQSLSASQTADSNSGGNTQGTTVGGDSTKVDPSVGYSAPGLAISENNVIGNYEAITNWFFQVPGIGGGGGSAKVHTTIAGLPRVAEALMIAGDPAYAASVEKAAYMAKLTPEQQATTTYNPAPDGAMSKAYAAVLCVEFEAAAEKYGIDCSN